MTLEVSVAERPRKGQRVSGDLHVVLPRPDGTLLAVLDAAGHGPEAAATARLAERLLQVHADQPLPELFRTCHEGLLRSRGIVMLVVSLQAQGGLSWLGVGNIEGSVLRAGGGPSEYLVSAAGVLGYNLPVGLRARLLKVEPGDLIVLATDGVGEICSGAARLDGDLAQLAEFFLNRSLPARDDALVAVGRVVA